MEAVSDILNQEFETLLSDVVARHEQAGQVATGKTRASFSHSLTGAQSGVFEGAFYSGALERGRGPARGGGGGNSDFLDNLKQWIVAKGLNYGGNEKGLERLAKFFRWYINKNGTKLFRSGQTEDILSTPINDFSERVSNRVGALFANEITNDIFN